MRMRPSMSDLRITGKTRYIPLIGHPVAQVKTPAVINALMAAAGLDAIMVPTDIQPGQVAAYFDIIRGSENCLGCSITVPHKQVARESVDVLTQRAQVASGVNIVWRAPDGQLVGYMTDGAALVAALIARGASPTGTHALVAGAGGSAGSAIAFSLADAGCARLTLLEPDKRRRDALTERLSALYPTLIVETGEPAAGTLEIAVNASPLGMQDGDPLPFDLAYMRSGGIVADAVTTQQITPLLAAARARGLYICTGFDMADAQLDFQMRHLRLK